MKLLFVYFFLLWPQAADLRAGGMLVSSCPSAEDPYGERAIRDVMALNGVSLSFNEKAVNRLGDRAAIGLMRVMADHPLSNPNQVRGVLSILHDAFNVPSMIVVEADREPKATLFLLEDLQKLPISRDLTAEIGGLKAFVSRNTK